MLADDGLLRTSTGCTTPLPSFMMYTDSLNLTLPAKIIKRIYLSTSLGTTQMVSY